MYMLLKTQNIKSHYMKHWYHNGLVDCRQWEKQNYTIQLVKFSIHH